jgi:hypothetical protein
MAFKFYEYSEIEAALEAVWISPPSGAPHRQPLISQWHKMADGQLIRSWHRSEVGSADVKI